MDEIPNLNFIRKEYKKLTESDIQEIINGRNNGLSASQIAQHVQCSERQVHRILKKNSEGEAIKKPKKEVDIIQKLDNSVIQEYHLAWIAEEFFLDPNASLEIIADRLNDAFNSNISVPTLWRNQRQGITEKVIAELRENKEKHLLPQNIPIT